MPGGDEPDNNGGRVTIRELYHLILEQNDSRHEMERRIVDKLDNVAACTDKLTLQATINKEEIDKLRTRSDRNDIIASSIGALAGFLTGMFGGK